MLVGFEEVARSRCRSSTGCRTRSRSPGYTSSWSTGCGRPRVARDQRDDRGEVAARAVAADRDRGRVAAELGRVRERPTPRGDAVVDRGRGTSFRARAGSRPTRRSRRRRRTAAGTSWSCVSRLPVTQPPPWNHTSTGKSGRRARPVHAHRDRRPPGPGIVRSSTSCTGCFGNARVRRRRDHRGARAPRASCRA